MNRQVKPKLLAIVLCCYLGEVSLNAQTTKPPAKPATSPPASQAPAKKEPEKKDQEADEAVRQRALLTQRAVAELESVVPVLKQSDNLASSLPLVRLLVKKLAAHRPERCRELLVAIYDTAAEQAERAEAKLKDGGAYQAATNFRTIISIAASFDAALARKLLDRFQENEKLAPVMDKSESGYHLAKELLSTDPQQAVAVANRLAGEAFTTRTLEFIGALRKQDPKLAQAHLSTLLTQLETRKYPSLNELLLLYPYVFLSNKLPIYVPESGRLAFLQNVEYGKDLDGLTVDAALARRYLQLGLTLLLASDRYLDGQPWAKADPRGDLAWLDLVLLPGARQYWPEAEADFIQRRGAVLGFLDPVTQEAISNSVQNVSTAKQNRPDEGDPLKQIADVKNPERRDQLYYTAAQQAVRKEDFTGALALIAEMSLRHRQQARELLVFEIAQKELDAGNAEAARRRIADAADMVRRAYLLTKIAVFNLEGHTKDSQRATECLNEAYGIAGKLDPGVEKTLVLAGAAAIFARFDQVRALEVLRDFTSAANKAEKFDGSNFLARSIQLNKFHYFSGYLYRDFTYTEVLPRLAHHYFDTLLAEARALNQPLAQTRAILALCETLL